MARCYALAVIPARRARLGSWLTVVIRQRPSPGGDGAARRLFVSAAWLLVALGVLIPAWETTVLLHDRRVVTRDFACLAAKRAMATESPRKATVAQPRPAEAAPEAVRIDLEVEGIGRVSFPPGLTDEETVAAMQALVVAHFRSRHAAHPPSPSARPVASPTPAASEPATPDRARAEEECRIGRAGDGPDELRSLSAWRSDYAGAPPSPEAELAARRAFRRSALAILMAPALFALRRWWRWVFA